MNAITPQASSRLRQRSPEMRPLPSPRRRTGLVSVGWCLPTAWLLVASLAQAAPAPVTDVADAAELARPASWTQPSDPVLADQLADWLATLPGITPADQAAAVDRWDSGTPPDRLDRLLQAVAESAAEYRPLQQEGDHLSPATVAAFTDRFDPSAGTDFGRQVVALWTARQLVRLGRYDEATPLLVKLSVATSPDPATLLFCRAACQYWLLQTEAAEESLARLLEREETIPVRYRQLALLLEADLASLEQDSLDHISRRMRDITRRLDLGHAGPRLRAVQDGVIDSLDKLIKKLEDKQQQQQQAASGAGGGGTGGDGRPMEDSQLAGGKGRGEVTSRDLGDGDDWGTLPPREREEALQQIGRDYPAHYREAIEQYFKRLAAGDGDR